MFQKILKINIIILFFFSITLADVIKDITIKGNKRLSETSIIMFGQIEIGTDYNSNELNLILKNLYETNFFKEVNLDIINNILNIDVIENPIIESLEINGIKQKKLAQGLKDSMKLKSRKSYVESDFLNDLNLVKNIIKQLGYYFADIETSYIKNEEQNSIRLIYDVDLGKKARISEIQFIGDKKIKDRKLKNIITSEQAKFWKFISSNIYLDRDRIDLDKRLLLNYYKDQGFYNAQIKNSFVEFQDKSSFKLIFNIQSGKKFTFNKLKLNVQDGFDPRHFKDINNLLSKLENEMYSLSKINKILEEIDKIALSKQYEFINAAMTEKIVDENKLDILIALNETEKFYVEKINIFGNQFTLEEVIRNTFIVDEGDPFNEILFNKSINDIKSKRIFSSVDFEIKEGSTKNFKTIDISVIEQPTGEISLGAGLGTSGGTIGAGIKEKNFLGRGINLDTNLAFTANSVKGQIVYSKPNFAYTDNSLFTSISSNSTDLMSESGYKTTNLGFSLGTAFEQYEDLVFRPELSVAMEDLETDSSASSALKKQAGDYFDFYFNYSLDYDLRNQRYQPSEGYRSKFTQELPIASEGYEVVNSYEYSRYQTFGPEMIGKVSFYGSAVKTIGDKDVRISKRLYIPSSKLRGFESGKVGPTENNSYIGGNYVSTLNLSTTLPQVLPSAQNVDFSLFFDAANIWGVDYDSSLDEKRQIRSATGVAMDLMTPIGPLNFTFTKPITKKSSDKTETFRFNLGTTF